MEYKKFNTEAVERSLSGINSCFSSILLETNYIKKDETFSWPSYNYGILNPLTYVAEYQRLIDKKQFSFLLDDKSFFQFFFEFAGEEVKTAKLSYYPVPVKISGAMDHIYEVAESSGIDLMEEFYFGAEEWMERGIDVVNTSHLRLDFDPKAENHAQCHLQFGGLNELRIPSRDLINPFVFFEWICKTVYSGRVDQLLNKSSYKETANYNLKRSKYIGDVDLSTPHLIAAH